jgi:hypothetical protein
MALFGNRNSKPDDTPFLAPEPEGPEEVSDKFQRLKEGRSGAAKRWLLEMSGLEGYSPAKRFLISAVATAELGMMGLNFFTDINLPMEFLLGAAVPLLALLIHKDENKANDPETPHTTHTQTETHTRA